MKGLTAFEAIGNLSDNLIMTAVIPEEKAPIVVPKHPSAFRQFMNGGWGVAAVCILVALGVMGGIIWAGNQPDPIPGGTKLEVTEPEPTAEPQSESTTNPETQATETRDTEIQDTETQVAETNTDMILETEEVVAPETEKVEELETEEVVEPETEDMGNPSVPVGIVRIRQYTWDGWGISNKTLDPKASARLLEKLQKLIPIDEYAESLATETMSDVYDNVVPESVERGTCWIETSEHIYRLSPELDAIWLVDRHYGGGQRLAAGSDFFDTFSDLWRYHPYDSYVVTYKNGEFTMNHVYEATSSIRVEIVKLEPDILTDDIDATDKARHKITLKIMATEDIQTRISLGAKYSDDHLMLGDGADLSLKAGVPQTITLTYPGRLSWGFEVNISIENVRIYLYHRPV
ncbi:MAG: hypothetical protein E7661_00525 [Ruminococcaceae bacterium]|nr:hypothetical protein [Oscillospiraceae bacterium]